MIKDNGKGVMTMKESTKEILKLEAGLLGIMLGGAGLFGAAIMVNERVAKHREAVISELRPYVARHDGQSGISDDDKVDFLRRAGIPGEDGIYSQLEIARYGYRNEGYDRFRLYLKVQGSGEVLIRSQDTDTLERVLKSYRAEKR